MIGIMSKDVEEIITESATVGGSVGHARGMCLEVLYACVLEKGGIEMALAECEGTEGASVECGTVEIAAFEGQMADGEAL